MLLEITVMQHLETLQLKAQLLSLSMATAKIGVIKAAVVTPQPVAGCMSAPAKR